jgi:transmembrane secretion effector
VAAPVPLRRNTAFQLLWVGGAADGLGTEVTKLATPLLVLAATGSPAWAGVVTGASIAGSMAVAVPAGVWIDRWDRRRVLATGQAVRVAVAVAVVAVVWSGPAQVWPLALLALVDGVAAAFAELARHVSVRAVVPDGQLRSAYTQEESRSHAARLAGPPLGGLLFGVGPVVPFLVDAASFAVALVASWLARVPRRPAARPAAPDATRTDRRGFAREVGEVLVWIWRRPGLRESKAVLSALNLFGSAFTIPLIVLVGQRGGGPVGTGMVLAAGGVAGLVGALAANRIGRLLPVGWMLVTIVAVFGVALLAMALPWGPWWPVVPLVVILLSTPSINVVLGAVNDRLVPAHMLGRMSGVFLVLARGLAPLGPVLGGTLAAGLGAAPALVVVGTVLVLTAALAAASRDLRRFTDEDPAESSTESLSPNATAERDHPPA